jgi:hypothetical protein
MTGALPTYLLGSLILSASSAEHQCKEFFSPPRTQQEFEKLWSRLLTEQAWEERQKNTSMMFRSPGTIEQALKRRIFDQYTIKEVAERELVGKSLEQARQQLLSLGFQGKSYGYGWHEPHECRRVYTAFVGITLSVLNDTVKSVIVKVGWTSL